MESCVTGTAIIERARAYLNVPFAANGRDQGGLDCGGLLLRVATDLGLPTPTVPNYQPGLAHGHVAGYLEPFCDRLDIEAPLSIYTGEGVEAGDFIIFSLAKGVQHLGISSGQGSFVHAWDSPSVGRVVETPLDLWWQDRVLSIYRLRGLAGA